MEPFLSSLSALTGWLVKVSAQAAIVIALVLSLSDYSIIVKLSLVGLDNYTQIFHYPYFWIALRNTAYYTLLYVPLGLVVSLATALLLNRSSRA